MAALMLALSGLLCTAACRDTPLAAAAVAPPAGARFVGTLVCEIDVKASRSRCQLVRDTAARAARLTIIRDAQTMVETGADAYTRADSTYALNIRLSNTSGVTLGTRDGTTVTGLKAFIPVNIMGYGARPPGDTTKPYAFLIPPLTNINQLVKARNPDGRMAFTAPDQPYWNYAQKLAPGETSQWRQWKFTLHPSVAYFYFAVSVFAAGPGEPEVPAVIPDNWSVPKRLYDPAWSRPCANAVVTRCVYDAVRVIFRNGATAEEREAAVNAVEGTLEGGAPATQSYFIRIAGDTSLVALQAALATLGSLPQVEVAIPFGPMPLHFRYIKPDDGPGWRNWLVQDSATDVTRANWALEAISAPLAWGCDTGSVAASVAILDSDFHVTADLLANVTVRDTLVDKLTSPADSLDHGTMTASIAGATGNNLTGITGTAWRSSLRLYDIVGADSAGQPVRVGGDAVINMDKAMANLERASSEGARVINISWGIDWTLWAKEHGYIPTAQRFYDPAAETDPGRQAARNAAFNSLSAAFRLSLQRIRARGQNPLIVIASGNDSTNGRWDPFTAAVAVYPNILSVGAARDAGMGQLAPVSSTNYGSLVEIYAPGQNVRMLDRNGPTTASGTSFAAPYVTGVAGLLLSFDPRLAAHPDSLKILILQGARAGQRRVRNGPGTDSVPVLHAYEALKAAAQRRGAPLCGNRIWTDSRKITVQRGAAFDTIANLGGGISRDNIDVLHGGRRIRVDFTGGLGRDSTLTYTLQNGTWQQVGTGVRGWVPAVPGSSGSYLGTVRRSHSGDTLLAMNEGKVFGFATLDLSLSWPGGSRTVPNQLRRATTADGIHSVCIIRNAATAATSSDSIGGCTTTALLSFYSESAGWSAVYHPLGGQAIVASSVVRGSASMSAWSTCPWPVTPTTPQMLCRSQTATEAYDPAEMRVVDLVTGAFRVPFTVNGNPRRMAIDESGSEFMIQRENIDRVSYLRPTSVYGQFESGYSRDVRTCSVEVWDLRRGTLKSVVGGVDCGSWPDHGLFITPTRAPSRTR